MQNLTYEDGNLQRTYSAPYFKRHVMSSDWHQQKALNWPTAMQLKAYGFTVVKLNSLTACAFGTILKQKINTYIDCPCLGKFHIDLSLPLCKAGFSHMRQNRN